MALEATHIRFALDLKAKYKIQNIKKYVSGSIYPDSRYVTKIERELTHPEDFLDSKFFQSDDFRKGWHAHLLCDKIQWKVTKELLPEVFKGQTGQGSQVWVRHSAIKILQNIYDIKKFPITEYLGCLDYVENPNGEDIKTLKKYNTMFKKMYSNSETVSIEREFDIWKFFGISDVLALQVKERVMGYSANKSMMRVILKIYPVSLKRALAALP